MKKQIIPTITTDDPAEFQRQFSEYLKFAPAIHVDISDGKFAPNRTVNLNQVYWREFQPFDARVVLHLMVSNPLDWLYQIKSLQPNLVIVHIETISSIAILRELTRQLRMFGVDLGLAILPETRISDVGQALSIVDDVLIFAGRLGYQGGVADLGQLDKVTEIRKFAPKAIIEWDGGANVDNIAQIAASGVSYINVGSAISSSTSAADAYRELDEAMKAVECANR